MCSCECPGRLQLATLRLATCSQKTVLFSQYKRLYLPFGRKGQEDLVKPSCKKNGTQHFTWTLHHIKIMSYQFHAGQLRYHVSVIVSKMVFFCMFSRMSDGPNVEFYNIFIRTKIEQRVLFVRTARVLSLTSTIDSRHRTSRSCGSCTAQGMPC
jgi:hypothetical protein